MNSTSQEIIQNFDNQNTNTHSLESKNDILTSNSCDFDGNKGDQQQITKLELDKNKIPQKIQNRISKKQIRKMNVFENKRNQIQQNSYQFIKYKVLQNIFYSQKCFLLEGGLCVELASTESDEEDQNQHLDKMKLVSQVLKYNDGSIQVDFSDKLVKDNYDYVINQLQSTQNYQDYDISIKLAIIRQQNQQLKLQIERTISLSEINTFNSIIQNRNAFVLDLIQKMNKNYLEQNDFAYIIPYCINWKTKQMFSSRCLISQAIIALLGTNSDGLVNYIMRKKFNWLFNTISRRKLIKSCLDFQISSKGQKSQKFIFEDFESIMIDNILIKSQCTFEIISIDYPPQLQFYGTGIDLVNQADSIIVIKLDITEDHLEQIMKIRQNNIVNVQTESHFGDDNQCIANNFEYYMQSQVFLEKFYNKTDKLIDSDESDLVSCNLKNRCNYKYINQVSCQ